MGKKNKEQFIGNIERVNDFKNRLVFKSPDYYKERINQAFSPGDRIRVTVENIKSQRSKDQNAYWWGVCYPELRELTGYKRVEDVHELCKDLFLKTKKIEIPDKLWDNASPEVKQMLENKGYTEKTKEVVQTRSTTSLSVGEGVEYTDCLRKMAEFLNGYIPTPNEAEYR